MSRSLKFYITYFYNVRFLRKNMLPISTAVWDPKWFHNNGGQDVIFMDKNGIYNGLRCQELSPYKISGHSCRKDCEQIPPDCSFLSEYRKYIYSLDFEKTYGFLKSLAEKFKAVKKLEQEPEICLLVHEKPDNPHSERPVLIDWFRENDVDIKEFYPDRSIK